MESEEGGEGEESDALSRAEACGTCGKRCAEFIEAYGWLNRP